VVDDVKTLEESSPLKLRPKFVVAVIETCCTSSTVSSFNVASCSEGDVPAENTATPERPLTPPTAADAGHVIV
jgi:hypothetical protein